MRRAYSALFVAVLTVVLASSAALAASPHFKKGGEPTCVVSGSAASKTVVCTGTLAGLGNEDLVINVTISGFTTYQCQNGGGNLVPGQNKVLEGPLTVPTLIPSDAIKNGTLTFTTNPATLTAASTVSGAAAGCPNNNWTGVNPTLTITDIRMTISQGGVLLFTATAHSDAGLFGKVVLTLV